MRVLYFSREYTTHDRHFLLKLAESKHQVWFLCLEDDGIQYEERDLPDGIHTVEWQGGRQKVSTVEELLRLMPDFERVLDQVHPDLIHAGPVQSCGFMTAMAGFRPFLVMSWGSDILVDADRDEMWRWRTCYTLNRSDMLLCDCDAVRLKVQKLLPYADKRIVQFPWGIDLCQFTPGIGSLHLRSHLKWEDTFIIISTRYWEKCYGIDILLDAFRRAYSQNSRLRLMLLGSGSLAFEIQCFISNHGLNNVVYLPGKVPHEQLPDYFRTADLYASCAYSDGTSISLLEAMATGLPVVVTNNPGNQEWVIPEENGWLVPAGDSQAFAQALLRAADMDPITRRKIVQRNRRIIEERANWNKNFAKLLIAYDQIEAKYVK